MNDLQHELEHVEARARRYWFEDGVAEMVAGLIFAIVGLYFVAEHTVRGWNAAGNHTTAAGLLSVAFPIMVVALTFGARRLIPAIKDRYVHPRTGYIAFRQRTRHRWATAALAAMLSMLFAIMAVRVRALDTWLPALQGGVFGAAFLWWGRRVQILRFPLEGLFAVAIGIFVSLLHLEENLAIGVCYGLLGLVMLAAGAIAFAGYLRHAPTPEQP